MSPTSTGLFGLALCVALYLLVRWVGLMKPRSVSNFSNEKAAAHSAAIDRILLNILGKAFVLTFVVFFLGLAMLIASIYLEISRGIKLHTLIQVTAVLLVGSVVAMQVIPAIRASITKK